MDALHSGCILCTVENSHEGEGEILLENILRCYFSLQSPNECLRVFVLAVNELKSCFDVTSLTTSIVDSLPHDHVHG